MSDDPKTPRTPEVVDLVEELQSKSPELEDHTTPRSSTSPTSSTPSSSPYDKGLKNSELLSSDESLVNSPITRAGNFLASPIAQAGRDLAGDKMVNGNSPAIKAHSLEGEVVRDNSPAIKAHSLEGEVVRDNSPAIKAHSLEGEVVRDSTPYFSSGKYNEIIQVISTEKPFPVLLRFRKCRKYMIILEAP